MSRHLVRMVLGLCLGLVFLGHAYHLYRIPLLSTLDAFVYDARLALTAPGGRDERIVIVDLDEASLAEVGRWPWARDQMAALVDRLFDEYRIRLLAFDVVFAEPDTSSGLATLERLAGNELRGESRFVQALERLRPALDHDQRFADALRGRSVVMGYYLNNFSTVQRHGALPEPVLQREEGSVLSPFVTHWSGYGGNLPVLAQVAASAGHFTPLQDADGVVRRVPLLVGIDGGYYEALSLAVVRRLFGDAPVRPLFAEGAGEQGLGPEWLGIRTPNRELRIPVDAQVATLIPYRGEQGSFSYLSAADVLAGRAPASRLNDRIVIVGTTAPGLMDLRSTPVGAAYPGVEIHANLIAGMLDGEIKAKPEYVLALDFLQVLLCVLVLALGLPFLGPRWATLLGLFVSAGLAAANLAYWHAGLAVPIAAAFCVSVLLYAFNMCWGYFVESRSKRQFTDLFGQYVPPELVDEMARDPVRYSMDGRNAELTVLFADVRGFTSISEGLDPHELTCLMNAYLSTMTEVIRRHRGTLDKYIGDAIMAFWGAPVADADHARHAVEAALDMQRAVRTLDAQFTERGWPLLHIGVGINTGTMTVGDMGSSVRKAYTVMGDAVNLASRIEGLTKQYGVGIVIGEETRARIGDYACREIDRVRVKGKAQPVALYEPLGEAAGVDVLVRTELGLWEQTLAYYRSQNWDAAEASLDELCAMQPDSGLYRLYRERLNHFRRKPPGDGWDGVTAFATK